MGQGQICIIYNAYGILVDGKVSMRERKGLRAAREGGGQVL